MITQSDKWKRSDELMKKRHMLAYSLLFFVIGLYVMALIIVTAAVMKGLV